MVHSIILCYEEKYDELMKKIKGHDIDLSAIDLSASASNEDFDVPDGFFSVWRQNITLLGMIAKLGKKDLYYELIKLPYMKKEYMNQGDKDNRTPLMQACIYNHTEIALDLIARGVNVNTFTTCEWPENETHISGVPLHYAIQNDNKKITDALLARHGINTHIKNHKGETPIDLGFRIGNITIICMLLKSGRKKITDLTDLHVHYKKINERQVTDLLKLFHELNKSIKLSIILSFLGEEDYDSAKTFAKNSKMQPKDLSNNRSIKYVIEKKLTKNKQVLGILKINKTHITNYVEQMSPLEYIQLFGDSIIDTKTAVDTLKLKMMKDRQNYKKNLKEISRHIIQNFDNLLCKICYNARVSVRFQCSHAFMCDSCYKKLHHKTCGYCRKQISSATPVFF